MNCNDLISVIIPLYNMEKYISDALNSVITQTYKNWEIIIIDDASKDNSPLIAKNFECNNIKLICLNEHKGPAYSRNIGIKNSKGRYITFLDADDIWKKEKLEKQLNFLKNNNYVFTFTGYEYADEFGLGTGKIVHVPNEINYKNMLKNTIISTITVMIDRKNIIDENLFMPTTTAREDFAAWLKILKSGIYAYGLDEPLCYYRRHNKSSSANKLKAVIGTWHTYRTYEQLSVLKALFNITIYIYNAVKKRL